MDLPHAPYLVMMAVGEFKKVTDTPWKGKEVSSTFKKNTNNTQKQFSVILQRCLNSFQTN